MSDGKITSTGEEKTDFLTRKKDELVKVASANFIQQRPYKSPFLSLSDLSIPDRMSDLFKWCKYFYTFDPLIHGAINALSSFPITRINLEESETFASKEKDLEGKDSLTSSSEQYRSIRYALFSVAKIYKLLIEIGIDYHLYGNCFVLGDIGKSEDGDPEWKSIRRLPPDSIIIDYMPDGESVYKWNPPERIKRVVKEKAPKDAYEKIPGIIKDAIRNNKAVVIRSSKIYHFKKPGDSLMDSAWGMPGVANVLKLLMYRNVLRQAQEAIAKEHIVPLRIFYLNPQGGMHPGSVGGGNFAGDQFGINPSKLLAQEIEKASSDPNYKIVSSTPVGMVTAGGHGRSLLLTGEIDQIQAEILAGLNVPREFIFGGVSYSGSSISLKILENHFITYRLLLEDFLNEFVIKGLAKERQEWVSEKDDKNLVKVTLTDLKMQDDVQQKQMVVNLNAAGKVTDSFLLKAFGIDGEKMANSLKEETRLKAEIQRVAMLEQFETETQMKKASMIQQLELGVFEKKLQDFSQMNENFEYDEASVADIIDKVQTSVSKKRLEVYDMQSQQMEKREQEKHQETAELAMDIVENSARDSRFGIDVIESLKGKMTDENYARLLYRIHEFIDVRPDVEKFEELVYHLEAELMRLNLDTHEEVIQKKLQEQEMMRKEEEENLKIQESIRKSEKKKMMQEGAMQQEAPEGSSGGSDKSPDEGVDMRPMPSQRPPRRESQGN